MSYAAWSVVFNEQPSAAKWNILGTNDASFNDGTGIADAAITSEHLNATIACRAYRSGAQTIEVGTEKVLLETENFDLGADFDTANNRFVAPLTGYYQVNGSTGLNNVNALDDQVLVYIYGNGAPLAQNNAYAVAAGDDPLASVSDIVSVTAGQFIELYIQNATSATEGIRSGSSESFMSIYFLGA